MITHYHCVPLLVNSITRVTHRILKVSRNRQCYCFVIIVVVIVVFIYMQVLINRTLLLLEAMLVYGVNMSILLTSCQDTGMQRDIFCLTSAPHLFMCVGQEAVL